MGLPRGLLAPSWKHVPKKLQNVKLISPVLGIILVGYAQTAAVGSVLMIGSTVYTELSGRSVRLSFDRKVCLFVGCFLALRCRGVLGMQAPCEAPGAETS